MTQHKVVDDDDDVRSGQRSTSDPEPARILIADDDPDMCLLLVSFLGDLGYKVCEAFSGTELLRLLRTSEVDAYPMDGVDLVIMDNRMPGLTGVEVLQKLRSSHWDGPLILMTAFPDAFVRAQAHKLDAILFPKPFSLESLRQTVRRVLSENAGVPQSRSRIPS